MGMSPAASLCMSADQSDPPASFSGQAETLVPVLQLDAGVPDPVALSTWHLALASSTALSVPHDLFALWVFPASGGTVLLGPPALAQDNVPVPVPSPRLLQDDLYRLEQILRNARYQSVIAVPIRAQARDVGVMLLGSFARNAFASAQASALYRLANRLTPALSQLALLLPAIGSHAALEPTMSAEELPEHLAKAACESLNGVDLVRRSSGVLYALLPHDKLEILVPGATEGAYTPLSGNLPRRRWGSASTVVDPFPALVAQFGNSATVLLEDVQELQGIQWVLDATPTRSARSVLGVRLEVASQAPAYLLLASVARDLYRPADEELLALAALILAPRVTGLRATSSVSEPAVRTELPLIRAANLLAETSHLRDGLADFAAEVGQLLPHRGIALRLRRGEDEVITLDPEAPRPFGDLPAVLLDDSVDAELFHESREWLYRSYDELEEVTVPLRVAGRTIGTLGVRSENFESARGAAAILRQFADVLAPHLELLRRAAGSGPSLRPYRVASAEG